MKNSLLWTFFKIELQRIFKNSDIRMMVFAAPILYGVILCFAYQKGRVQEVPVGVVSEDNSLFTRELLRQIDATEEVQLHESYLNLPEAAQAMARGETFATLFIPRDFTQKRLQLRQSPLYLASNTSNFALANPTMVGASKVTQIYGAGTLMTVLRKAGLPQGKSLVMANPVALNAQPIFNPLLNYSYFFVPGLIYAILQQIIIVGLCFSLTEQKDSGTWKPETDRKRILPYVLGRSLPYALINLTFSMVFIYGLLPLIHIPSLANQFFLILSLGFCFTMATSIMAFLFGLLFKDSVTAFVALMFYSMPAFLISGMSWPSYNLSWGLKILSWLTPITHFGDAIRRTLLEPQVGFVHVMNSFLALALFAAAALGLCYLILRKESSAVAPVKN